MSIWKRWKYCPSCAKMTIHNKSKEKTSKGFIVSWTCSECGYIEWGAYGYEQ